MRARDDARVDLMRSRHRLSKLLLRRGHRVSADTVDERASRSGCSSSSGRTRRSDTWCAITSWPFAHLEARLAELDRAIEEIAIDATLSGGRSPRCAAFAGSTRSLAMTLLAELYDIRRFPHPRALMAFVGLVPSEALDRRPPEARRPDTHRQYAGATNAHSGGLAVPPSAAPRRAPCDTTGAATGGSARDCNQSRATLVSTLSPPLCAPEAETARRSPRSHANSSASSGR